MHHEYYYYNKEQLLANPKIPMVVMEDKPTVQDHRTGNG